MFDNQSLDIYRRVRMFERSIPAVRTRTAVSEDIMSDETTNMERVQLEVDEGETFVDRKRKRKVWG